VAQFDAKLGPGAFSTVHRQNTLCEISCKYYRSKRQKCRKNAATPVQLWSIVLPF